MENKKQQSTIIKDAVMLFIITIIAGALLGFFNQLTKEPIAAANKKAKDEAYQLVMEQAESFEEDSALTEKMKAATPEGTVFSEVMVAEDGSKTPVGYVMSVIAKEGYGGDISLTLGVDMSGTITAIEVISQSETAGLGANCTKDDFKSRFAGVKSDETLKVTKDGGTIDAMSGATITSRAVTKAVDAGYRFIVDNALSVTE